MPRHYSDGRRVARGPAGRMPGGRPLPNTRSFKERVGALRNLWPFLVMVWRTSPQLTAASLLLRLVRALVPVAALYVGKLIIDDVVLLVEAPDKPETFQQWLQSGLLNRLGLLLLAEFALAVMTDVLGRVVSLVDSLLSERVSNASSVRLMEHAATLDLEDFEDAGFQDQLERAPPNQRADGADRTAIQSGPGHRDGGEFCRRPPALRTMAHRPSACGTGAGVRR